MIPLGCIQALHNCIKGSRSVHEDHGVGGLSMAKPGKYTRSLHSCRVMQGYKARLESETPNNPLVHFRLDADLLFVDAGHPGASLSTTRRTSPSRAFYHRFTNKNNTTLATTAMLPPPKRLKGTVDSSSLTLLAPASGFTTASMASSPVGITYV
jgi:hypothetical protein